MKKRVLKTVAFLMSMLMMFGVTAFSSKACEQTLEESLTGKSANDLLKAFGLQCYNQDNKDGSNADIGSVTLAQGASNRYLKIQFGESQSYPQFYLSNTAVPRDMSSYTVRIDFIIVEDTSNKLCNLFYGSSGTVNGSVGFRTGAYTAGKDYAIVSLSNMAEQTASGKLFFGQGDFAKKANTVGTVHTFEVTVSAAAIDKIPTISVTVDGIAVGTQTDIVLTSSRIGFSAWKTSSFGIDNIYVKNNATGEVVYDEDFENCVYFNDIAQYRSNGNYTYPTKQNRVFAGWYADKNCTEPLASNVQSGGAYAKFVFADVLSLKTQVSQNTNSGEETADLRLVTSVDSLHYANVGFQMIYNGQTAAPSSTTVYQSITGMGESYTPSVFSCESQYFATFSIASVPASAALGVTPFWTTFDGTVVSGAGATVEMNVLAQAMENQNTVRNYALQYTVVYPENAAARVKTAAQTLKSVLEGYTGGETVAINSDSSAETTYEILIGDTNRKQSDTDVELAYYDYLIRTDGNKIVIRAGGGFAMENAVEHLVEFLTTEQHPQTLYRFDTSLFNSLAFDQRGFVPAWEGTITVPDWMTDFEEKLYAITNPAGRPMCVAHRGDVINYPEDSLEGFLSAALLGADVIEMDLCLTKDHVLVLCHDATLSKVTNVAKFMGKNGLPNSEYISDWTYAELQQLSLLDRSGKETQYKLPSYYEILMTLRGRCFLMIDQKELGSFTYEDVFEMETVTDSVELSVYSMFVSSKSGPAQGNSYRYVIDYSTVHPEMTRLASYVEKLEAYMAISGHKIRSRGWINGNATTDPSAETHTKYLTAYETNGLKLIYTNNIPLMSAFIAAYEPDLS